MTEQRTAKTMGSPWRSVFGYLVTRWAGHNACHGPVARTADELLNFRIRLGRSTSQASIYQFPAADSSHIRLCRYPILFRSFCI